MTKVLKGKLLIELNNASIGAHLYEEKVIILSLFDFL